VLPSFTLAAPPGSMVGGTFVTLIVWAGAVPTPVSSSVTVNETS